jgi:hypothetical protein
MTGAESRTFRSRIQAERYGRGNMERFRVSGPHKSEYDGSTYYIVGGTTKHHTKRKYRSTDPFHKGSLTKNIVSNIQGTGGRRFWGV